MATKSKADNNPIKLNKSEADSPESNPAGITNLDLYRSMAAVASSRFDQSTTSGHDARAPFLKVFVASDKEIHLTYRILAKPPADGRAEGFIETFQEQATKLLPELADKFEKAYNETEKARQGYLSKIVYADADWKTNSPKSIKLNHSKQTDDSQHVEYLGQDTYLGHRGAVFSYKQVYSVKEG